MLHRRAALAMLGLGFAGAQAADAAGPSAANQWFPVRGDDGHPVPNLRLPVELAAEVEELPGAIWGGGGANPAVVLVSFYDFNCPWCRAASRDLAALMAGQPDLRVGLVNNPLLSAGSAQAAKVQLALLQIKGAVAAHALYDSLFSAPGQVDGPRALVAASALADRREIESVADSRPIGQMLGRQMRLAASLGLVATPSYVVGGAAILGYPGPKALARIVTDSRTCGTIVC